MNAPPLVKVCFESMKHYSKEADVIILDKETYKDYVTLPQHILSKFEREQITVTHLSDIIRMQLLYQYGGLWLDSTVLVTSEIPDDIFEMPFYTISYDKQYKWTAFLIGGEKGCVIFKEQNRLLSQYWKKEELLVEYLLIDYVMELLYSHNHQVKELIDAVPREICDILKLGTMLNEKYDSALYGGTFHKLNRKICLSADVPAETNYHHILKQYGVPFDVPAGQYEPVVLRKCRSFFRHLRNHFDRKRIQQFGGKLCLLSFASACVRAMDNPVARNIKEKHRIEILGYLEKRYGQWLV